MKSSEFLQIVAQKSGYRNPESLRYRCESIFKGVDLSGASVLEIGAGRGELCFWAALQGATEVVGLEPEIEGSTHGFTSDFADMLQQSGLHQVKLVKQTIQDYEAPAGYFDVIVSQNSLEHLDESASPRLGKDRAAVQVYAEIFQKIHRMLKPGGVFIATNASQENFWPMIGARNPISPQIEWHLHPPPRIWRKLMVAAGFKHIETDWPVRHRLRHFGVLTANPVFAFFTESNFRLVARGVESYAAAPQLSST
jgi:SAM-dependent methyltransferase